MKRTDVIRAAMSAAVTFGVVMGMGVTGVLDASDVAEPVVKVVETPTLVTGGCNVELREEKVKTETGEELAALMVVATNTSENAADLELTVSCMRQEATSPMRRMMPMPMVVWSKPVGCHVEAGETVKVMVTENVEKVKPVVAETQMAQTQVQGQVQSGMTGAAPRIWFNVSDGKMKQISGVMPGRMKAAQAEEKVEAGEKVER